MHKILEIFTDKLILGNSAEQWVIALSFIIGALVLNRIIIILNKNVLQKMSGKTESKLDDILFKMMESPVLFGIVVFSVYLATEKLTLSEDMAKIIAKAFPILIVVNITWFVSRLVKALIEEYMVPNKMGESAHIRGKSLDYHVVVLFQKTTNIIIWAIGVVVALNNVGYNISALLGTLGIGGLAFAFAAQDTLKNIFGGFTILTDRPFKLGDRILVDGFDGIVEDIGIRSTRIRTLERKLVTIPNSKMSDFSIENVSEEPMRRVLIKLGLTYDTKPEKMEEALAILKGLDKEIDLISDEILAWFSDYGDFSLNLTFIYFIKKESDIVQSMSVVNMAILKKFNEAGLNFAFPTQTIHLEKN